MLVSTATVSPLSPLSQTSQASPAAGDARPFIIALRAVAAIIIAWHHFALYAPLKDWAAPFMGELLDWLAVHARATQVFFVVGGYVMALSMSRRQWRLPQLGHFLVKRYCRLGLPYLAAMALVALAYAFARDWLPEDVTGSPISLPQVLAHLFFLQGLLGYEQLSAGFWFVCINFQLGLIYVAMLWLRDGPGRGRFNLPLLLGWPLAAYSLFHFNLNEAWDGWWLYFFPYFFMGVVIHHAVKEARSPAQFWYYVLLLGAAMIFEWRWRLASALLVGALLCHAEWRGWGSRWPGNRLVLKLGQLSYSLFLVHFPVLVFVGALWTRLEFNSPEQAALGLGIAFLLSLGLAQLFHRWVEQPAAALGRQLMGRGGKGASGRRREPAYTRPALEIR
ncbi:hypothetical protein AZSI13_25490 [Azospira sp. I13]|uniref:acyltransferase family protein n=1 Tax=Azospira sp. I13 TaxID=1765050 RepID=UPI000D4EAC22|nr:acyltransferase [Azospira sp. I13]GBG03222.1 hypothetical protein AZSI13_25490 [Azospira sp. I13]